MRGIVLLVILAGLLAYNCAKRDNTARWKSLNPAMMSHSATRQKSEALAAKEALFANLSRTMQTVSRRDGLESAVTVCRTEAPKIAAEIARDRDLRIGRTSFKLRNPENTPPDWAVDLIRNRVDKARYVEGPNGEFGALLPIRLRKSCLVCHGPEDDIDPAVRKKIAEAYPEDRAMGFSANDLRGWFWVEVPERAREN